MDARCLQEPAYFTLVADSAILGAQWDFGGAARPWDRSFCSSNGEDGGSDPSPSSVAWIRWCNGPRPRIARIPAVLFIPSAFRPTAILLPMNDGGVGPVDGPEISR